MLKDASDKAQQELATARAVLLAQCAYPEAREAWHAMRATTDDDGMRELEKVPDFMRRIALVFAAKGLDLQARAHSQAATWAESIMWHARHDRQKPALKLVVNNK